MSRDDGSVYEELMRRNSLNELPIPGALQVIARLVDVSGDVGRGEGITKALQWCDELARRDMGDVDTALLEYFRANAWGHREEQ